MQSKPFFIIPGGCENVSFHRENDGRDSPLDLLYTGLSSQFTHVRVVVASHPHLVIR